MKKDRIPEQVLPGNYYDGEILYGSEMNKIVNVLRTGVNANKNDIDSIILEVEKHASVINLGIIDFSELDDITQVGIYKFSVRRPDDVVDNYLLFQTFANGLYTQTIYNGSIIEVRRGINGNWSYWETINLLDINLNQSEINLIHSKIDLVEDKVNENTDDISDLNSSLNLVENKVNKNIEDISDLNRSLDLIENKVNKNTDDISDLDSSLNLVENKVNKNTDDISDLNYSLYVVNVKVDDNITETNKKLDKETYQEQIVRSKVNFRGGIDTNRITSPDRLVIENDTVFGINATGRVHAGEYYEGLTLSDDTRLATRKYVIDRFAELIGGSPDVLDTIYELAEALKNNPDVIDELLNEIAKVEQKADTHIADVNNPHEVTAEQVGTYDKTTIDLKDADVLQEAKAYTYSKVEIDNKDADVLQAAKDYTYSKSVIDNKDASTLQAAKDYTYSKVEIDDKDTAIMNEVNNKVDKTTKVNGKALSSDITLTKADIGLSNVDNTSDLDKPISTAVQIELDKNKNAIDNIISGRQTVGKALTAVNLTSQERQPIEDMFSSRITAKYENEIISSFDEDTTAVIDEIGGFSVKQLVKDGETTVELTQGNVYLAKASGTNITLSSGTQTIELPKGIAKFTASESGTYTFNGLILEDCQVYSLTEMGIADLSLEQVNQLLGLGNKSYPYGITNTKPSKLISVSENLFDWREFYEALKAVDPDNVQIVNKDGRECIKITNPRVYSDAGIKLWQGKFAPNVRYMFSSYHLNEGTDRGVIIIARYTDGTSYYLAGDLYYSSWDRIVRTTFANKTIDYITVMQWNPSTITYFDINTMQLQMLDNPETEFIPYTENEVKLPTAYADYGMPSLPNGVRDRIFRLGDRPDNSEWFYEKNVEKVILNGSEDFVVQLSTSDTAVLFYQGIENIKYDEPTTINVINDFFTNASYSDIYNDRVEGIASRGDQRGLTINIKKSRMPGWDDNWTNVQKVNAFKQWLQENPITVYYQLDKPQLTRIDDWNSQYLAYNYGHEIIIDSEGNPTPAHTVIKYYPDYVKQVQTNKEALTNKAIDFSVVNDTKYPTTKAVKDLVDATVGNIDAILDSILGV